MLDEKRTITPQKAIALLKKNSVIINEEDVENILDFLYFLALLFYKQHAAEL
jgi:hypothetical protein